MATVYLCFGLNANSEIRGIRIHEQAFFKDAIRAEGVSTSTFYAWVSVTPEFQDALKKAGIVRDAPLAEKALRSISNAFEKDWRSAAWFLERTFPHLYSLQPHLRSDPERLMRAMEEINDGWNAERGIGDPVDPQIADEG